MKSQTRLSLLCTGLALVITTCATFAHGADGTWNTTTNGTWTTNTNWLSNTIADGTDSTAFFTFNITNDLDVALGANRTIGNITFTDSTTSSNNMTISGANSLTMNVTTGTPVLDVTQSDRTLTISSVIAGNDGLQKSGPGALTFSAAGNTFTGGLTINAGTVTTASSGSGGLGSNAILLGDTSGSESATLLTGGGLTISNAITVRSGSSGVKTISQSTSGSTTFSGNWTLDGDLVFSRNVAGTTLKNTGIVSGNGSVTLSGNTTGVIGFGGNNTFTGGTTINSGVTVVVTTSSTGTAGNPTSGAFGSGTAPLVLNGGQMRASNSAGSYTVGNVVTLSANTTFLSIATENDLTFTGPVTLTGNRTLTTNVGFNVAGKSVIFSGAIGDSGSGFGLTQAGATANGTLTLAGSNTFSGPTAVTSGILNLGSSLALQNSPLNTTASVNGTASAGLRTTVTTLTLGGLTGNKNLASIFSTSSGNYTGVTALTLNPGTGATPSYAAAIADGATGMNLIKSGAGTQTLNGTNTYSGTTTISVGTLALGSAGSIDNTSGIVLAGGTFDVSAKVGGYSTANLSGNGDVVGALTVTNQLAIGSSPGTIDFESLVLGGSSTFLYEVTGGGSTADLGNVLAALNLGNATLSMAQLGTYTPGDKFTLFGYNAGNLTGTFIGLGNGTTFTTAGGNWTINYADASPGLNGGAGNLFVTVMAVPEPASIAIVSLGLGGLLILHRFRRT